MTYREHFQASTIPQPTQPCWNWLATGQSCANACGLSHAVYCTIFADHVEKSYMGGKTLDHDWLFARLNNTNAGEIAFDPVMVVLPSSWPEQGSNQMWLAVFPVPATNAFHSALSDEALWRTAFEQQKEVKMQLYLSQKGWSHLVGVGPMAKLLTLAQVVSDLVHYIPFIGSGMLSNVRTPPVQADVVRDVAVRNPVISCPQLTEPLGRAFITTTCKCVAHDTFREQLRDTLEISDAPLVLANLPKSSESFEPVVGMAAGMTESAWVVSFPVHNSVVIPKQTLIHLWDKAGLNAQPLYEPQAIQRYSNVRASGHRVNLDVFMDLLLYFMDVLVPVCKERKLDLDDELVLDLLSCHCVEFEAVKLPRNTFGSLRADLPYSYVVPSLDLLPGEVPETQSLPLCDPCPQFLLKRTCSDPGCLISQHATHRELFRKFVNTVVTPNSIGCMFETPNKMNAFRPTLIKLSQKDLDGNEVWKLVFPVLTCSYFVTTIVGSSGVIFKAVQEISGLQNTGVLFFPTRPVFEKIGTHDPEPGTQGFIALRALGTVKQIDTLLECLFFLLDHSSSSRVLRRSSYKNQENDVSRLRIHMRAFRRAFRETERDSFVSLRNAFRPV